MRRVLLCSLAVALAGGGCARTPWATEHRPASDPAATETAYPGLAGVEQARWSEEEQRAARAALREAVDPDHEPGRTTHRGLRWPEGVRRAVARAGAEGGVELVVVRMDEEEGGHVLRFSLRAPQGTPVRVDVRRVEKSPVTFVDSDRLEIDVIYGRFPEREANLERGERLLHALRQALGEEDERRWIVRPSDVLP